MTHEARTGDEQDTPEPRDNVDERIVGAGWGTTLRMITLRLGSAYAEHISQRTETDATPPASATKRVTRWAVGATVAALAAYAHARGIL